jgi:predicted transcriptional regulator
MTGTIRALVAEAETWPEEDQQELVQYARDIRARRAGLYVMTEEERAAVAEGLEQTRRGEFAPQEEIDAFWRRHGIA